MIAARNGILRMACAGLLLLTCSAFGPKKPEEPLKGFRFQSVKVNSPEDFDQEYPDAPNASAMNNNCRACHSPSMVLTQPKMSRGEWEKIVSKMVQVYHAPVPPEDVPKILDYLDNH